tara:strand:- start:2133 stop:2552 length:420 start_codon:yes stop_codon:yes gene_type:complete
MQRKVLISAAIFGILSVIIGAWSAHGINSFIDETDPERLNKIASFRTGVQYQFFHTFFLLFLSLIHYKKWTIKLDWVYRLIVIGVVLFSGSIYLLALRNELGLEGITKVLGPITPIGGLVLTAAWTVLLIYALKMKKFK